jgi:chromosome segregation ATPase
VKIADEKDTLESDKLAAEAARDELSKRVAELDALLDESEVKYQSTLTSEGQWEAQVAVLRAEILAAADRNQAEIARYKEEAADLNQQLVSMKDTTSIGSKQREIESLKEDLKNNFELLEEMHRALETSEADKEQLAKKLVELDTNFETKLYDKVSSEREHNRVLQKRMAGMKTRLDETEARSGAFEKEIARLQREIDELNNWKVVYENGHGFQELARHQMKLKEDNRRLSLAIEELTQKVGESMDANAVLSQAFEKLKAEAGYDPDFHYPELVLKEDMQSENARLQSQVHELDEQVMALENDCIRLRKALKNQVLDIFTV